jgi:hypothetical protein
MHQPFLRFWIRSNAPHGLDAAGVSTLLEILGLRVLVVVGF